MRDALGGGHAVLGGEVTPPDDHDPDDYALGIDLGTTFSAAAVSTGGRAETVQLGQRASSVPSVLYLDRSGVFKFGDAAEVAGAADPIRVARGFKRRFGGDVGLELGGVELAAHELTAELLRWIAGGVAEQYGRRPTRTTLTCPASWGAHRRDLLGEASRLAGLDAVGLITEPEAAALFYAVRRRVAPGAVVAVYDFGGGTFDATLLRKTGTGFELLGRTEGVEVGGMDLDAELLGYVLDLAGVATDHLALDDPDLSADLAALESQVVQVKEVLSEQTSVTVEVRLGHLRRSVTVQRGAFADLIRPVVESTVDVLLDTMASAGVAVADLASVLLVGGSSRIPLVAEVVTARVAPPEIARDTHPKFAVCLGAAIAAGIAVSDERGDARPFGGDDNAGSEITSTTTTVSPADRGGPDSVFAPPIATSTDSSTTPADRSGDEGAEGLHLAVPTDDEPVSVDIDVGRAGFSGTLDVPVRPAARLATSSAARPVDPEPAFEVIGADSPSPVLIAVALVLAVLVVALFVIL